MAVLKLRRQACSRCGSAIDLPHTTADECLHASTQETQELLRRSRALIEKRAALTRTRAARLRKSLRQDHPKKDAS